MQLRPSQDEMAKVHIEKARDVLVEEIFVPIAEKNGYKNLADHKMSERNYVIHNFSKYGVDFSDGKYPYGVVFSATKRRNLSDKDSLGNQISLIFSIDHNHHSYNMAKLDASISRPEGDLIYPAYKSGNIDVAYEIFGIRKDKIEVEKKFVEKMFKELEETNFVD